MITRHLRGVLDHLRRVTPGVNAARVSDSALLERFLAQRDEATFELLVWRHGPLVFGVCGRVLANSHDVEDAFQATFLTLFRKAHTIGKRESVSSWLYKVAYRTALRARTRLARQAAREKPLDDLLPDQSSYTPDDEVTWRDLRPVLDAEVQRLPERFRVPFILCYLEGKTNAEAAEELGCPKGTILSRLARARERLRLRLVARGLAIAAMPLVNVLNEHAGTIARVSPVLVYGTVSLAFLTALGKIGATDAGAESVVKLSDGVIRQFTTEKITAVVAVLLALAALGIGAGRVTHSALSGPATPDRGYSGGNGGGYSCGTDFLFRTCGTAPGGHAPVAETPAPPAAASP